WTDPAPKRSSQHCRTITSYSFACHGISDPQDPANSHLVLLSEDYKRDNLSVRAVSSADIQSAQIAYLSACLTADNPSETYADEVIHIASGFQLAGFAHVLGALWPSQSQACVLRTFIKRLFGGKVQGHEKVSYAMHHAVDKWSKEKWRQPLMRALFVHMG
ncbi:hypothetical protein L873DRAFT_1584774, partial [Choiromyces venosus 120613-1]